MTQNVEQVLTAAFDAWRAEIQRRSAEYDAGGVEVIEWAELKASARRKANANG
jgi:hypothetical protein